MEELDDLEIGETGAKRSRGSSGHVRGAGLLFAAVLAVAATVAVVFGDRALAWGYVGAFAVTVAIGAAVLLRADRRDRSPSSRPSGR